MEFQVCFQINEDTTFWVEYMTMGYDFEEKKRLFSTSASGNSPLRAHGQCQDIVLPEDSAAMSFYKKWNKHHLKPLNDEQVKELAIDIAALKDEYAYIERTAENLGDGTGDIKPFDGYDMTSSHMMEPKSK